MKQIMPEQSNEQHIPLDGPFVQMMQSAEFLGLRDTTQEYIRGLAHQAMESLDRLGVPRIEDYVMGKMSAGAAEKVYKEISLYAELVGLMELAAEKDRVLPKSESFEAEMDPDADERVVSAKYHEGKVVYTIYSRAYAENRVVLEGDYCQTEHEELQFLRVMRGKILLFSKKTDGRYQFADPAEKIEFESSSSEFTQIDTPDRSYFLVKIGQDKILYDQFGNNVSRKISARYSNISFTTAWFDGEEMNYLYTKNTAGFGAYHIRGNKVETLFNLVPSQSSGVFHSKDRSYLLKVKKGGLMPIYHIEDCKGESIAQFPTGTLVAMESFGDEKILGVQMGPDFKIYLANKDESDELFCKEGEVQSIVAHGYHALILVKVPDRLSLGTDHFYRVYDENGKIVANKLGGPVHLISLGESLSFQDHCHGDTVVYCYDSKGVSIPEQEPVLHQFTQNAEEYYWTTGEIDEGTKVKKQQLKRIDEGEHVAVGEEYLHVEFDLSVIVKGVHYFPAMKVSGENVIVDQFGEEYGSFGAIRDVVVSEEDTIHVVSTSNTDEGNTIISRTQLFI
jgi:hypothetical protein